MRKQFNYVSLLLVLLFGMSISLQAQDYKQKKFKRFKLGPAINTLMFDEYAPTVSRDGKTIIFQSNRDKKWGTYLLYQATKDEQGNWSEPAPIEAINGEASAKTVIAGPYLSYDALTLYFSANFDGDMNIYYSTRESEDAEWGEPTPIAGVNTGDYEGFPTVSADGERLYYMSRTGGQTASEGEEAGDSESTGKSAGKGQVLCYTLMVAKKTKANSYEFGAGEELPAPINADCEKAVRIAPDGETIYFASMRSGAKKGIRDDARDFDLFYSRLEEGGTSWSEPIAADFANHLSSDLYPSLVAADGATTSMYFSADMNISHEIFWTVVPEESAPKQVMEIGGIVLDSITLEPVQINDMPFDNQVRATLSYKISNDDKGEFSTHGTEGTKYVLTVSHPDYITKTVDFDYTDSKPEAVYDTYKRILLAPKGIDVNIATIDVFTEEPVDANVALSNDENSSITVEKKGTGKFYSRLDPGKKYTANATADGYEEESKEIDLTNVTFGATVDETIEMVDLSVINFDNINYATARPRTMTDRELTASLDATATANLDKVLQFLKDYPKFGVKIEAHTDYRGGDDTNQSLSERRAAAAMAYLKSKGIAENRLQSKGFGEANPTVPNEVDGKANQQNMALNRRVEFKVFRVK